MLPAPIPLFFQTIYSSLRLRQFCGFNRNVHLHVRDFGSESAVQPQEGVLEGEFDPVNVLVVVEVLLDRDASHR